MTDSDSTPSKSMPSLRVIIEGVAVAGLIWLASALNQNNIAIAKLQVQIAQVQASLIDVPGLTREIAKLQTTVSEHERRITSLENGSNKANGWKR